MEIMEWRGVVMGREDEWGKRGVVMGRCDVGR